MSNKFLKTFSKMYILSNGSMFWNSTSCISFVLRTFYCNIITLDCFSNSLWILTQKSNLTLGLKVRLKSKIF